MGDFLSDTVHCLDKNTSFQRLALFLSSCWVYISICTMETIQNNSPIISVDHCHNPVEPGMYKYTW
jgi:hypothetical protein